MTTEAAESTALVVRAAELLRPLGTGEQWKEAWNQYQEAKRFLVDRKHDVLVLKGREGEEAREFLRKPYWRKAASFFGLSVTLTSETERYVECDPDRCPSDCGGKHYEVLAVYRATYRTGQASDGDGSCVDNEKWSKASVPVRATPKQVEFAYKLYNDARGLCELIELNTGGRARSPETLTKAECSSLIEWLKSDCKGALQFKDAHQPRNTRHNTRSTAHTRAYNRAVSNLIGGGEVSAEEIIVDDSLGAEFTELPPDETEDTSPARKPAKEKAANGELKDSAPVTTDMIKLINEEAKVCNAAIEDELATASNILQREVRSLRDLTVAEARRVYTAFKQNAWTPAPRSAARV